MCTDQVSAWASQPHTQQDEMQTDYVLWLIAVSVRCLLKCMQQTMGLKLKATGREGSQKVQSNRLTHC